MTIHRVSGANNFHVSTRQGFIVTKCSETKIPVPKDTECRMVIEKLLVVCRLRSVDLFAPKRIGLHMFLFGILLNILAFVQD